MYASEKNLQVRREQTQDLLRNQQYRNIIQARRNGASPAKRRLQATARQVGDGMVRLGQKLQHYGAPSRRTLYQQA